MILDDILVKLKTGNKNKAYTVNGTSYTYIELYKYVCNIYKFLLEKNTLKRPVIIYGKKEVYMKACFLACSFAGITYVPIDKSIPKERVKNIINQIEPFCIIGDFVADKTETISEKQIINIMNKKTPKEIEDIYLKKEDIYYIIFTSGSTGTPKGVKVTYANLDSCIKWLTSITKIEGSVILNQANFSFDLSVADLYLSLVTGSEHFILENNKLEFNKIFEELKKSNAEIAVFTPSFADLLLLDKKFNENLLPNLKTILFCGEKLLNSTVQKLFERFKNIEILNSYGPTECTFAVTAIKIAKQMQVIPVGIPKKGIDIFIIDENKKIAKDEEIGEILIVGDSVSNGYVKEIDCNPFIEYNGKKAYYTGDLGYLENGILYIVGRKDNQIKYKGYRIELKDIEENFYKLGYVEKVIVCANKNEENIVKRLIAFVKLNDPTIKIEEIKRDLKLKIPEYMMPNIKIIEEFPINNNGKVDVEKLRRIK